MFPRNLQSKPSCWEMSQCYQRGKTWDLQPWASSTKVCSDPLRCVFNDAVTTAALWADKTLVAPAKARWVGPCLSSGGVNCLPKPPVNITLGCWGVLLILWLEYSNGECFRVSTLEYIPQLLKEKHKVEKQLTSCSMWSVFTPFLQFRIPTHARFGPHLLYHSASGNLRDLLLSSWAEIFAFFYLC